MAFATKDHFMLKLQSSQDTTMWIISQVCLSQLVASDPIASGLSPAQRSVIVSMHDLLPRFKVIDMMFYGSKHDALDLLKKLSQTTCVHSKEHGNCINMRCE